jgi:hypothetical protein
LDLGKTLTTKKATYELINDILSALKDKLIVGGIYCDLAKAFDILLSKLNLYGITGKANEWIKSCLKNRYQRVEIKNKNFSPNAFSNWGVIGPLLFLLYTNLLSKTINKNLIQFYLQMNTVFKSSNK